MSPPKRNGPVGVDAPRGRSEDQISKATTPQIRQDRSAPAGHSVRLPPRPNPSGDGQRICAATHDRDLRLTVETGGTLYDARTEFEQMTPDEREALLLDGLRWRHYWKPEQVARRSAWRRWLLIASSTAISAIYTAPGPSFDDLQRRRADVRPMTVADPATVRRWVRTGHSSEAAARRAAARGRSAGLGRRADAA